MAMLNFESKFPKVHRTSFIAASAEIIGDVEIGEHSGIWFNAVIRGDRSKIKIGNRTNIQDNVVIHSDPEDNVEIGNGVTVGHGAILHGCKIKDNVIIGMNATVLDGAEVGENSMVGANALVPSGKKFPDKSVILGVPASVKREATDADIKKIRDAAALYAELGKKYRDMQSHV